MISRRLFLHGLAGSSALATVGFSTCDVLSSVGHQAAPRIKAPQAGEDILAYIRRMRGAFDSQLYAQILGAANEFKEGDEIVGVAAADEDSREHARSLLSATRISDIDSHPVFVDELFRTIGAARDTAARDQLAAQTMGELRTFLLSADEDAIKAVMPGLSSDVIACVVKLLTNQELIRVGRTVFNRLPGSQIGAKGYLGARTQPNSPTDNVDDIRWQVFSGFSYAVGDVLLGNNPVSSELESVLAIERTLQDLLTTFDIDRLMPHCVLAHVDVQADVEKKWPGSTKLWFQSIAGCDTANATFDINVNKMQSYARKRSGPFGLYFETGQGADFTNGHGHGFDMVMHESRKYGFARALLHDVAKVRRGDGDDAAPWVHLNDVAGFIGPEVFRTREQLVRCCLEDVVMGKLHGLCIGLDVCSTLHMDISLDDLDWCLDQIMPANPAYLMALPTKIDPMLGYLTTGFQDHVRIRDKFGYRVNDAMWNFFQHLQVINEDGTPTPHFGDPLWVYLQYRRRKGDDRTDTAIISEGRAQLAEVRERGVFVASGHGDKPWDLEPDLHASIHRIYDDAKVSIRAEFTREFIASVPDGISISTQSTDRDDYILHPTTGEIPSRNSVDVLQRLRAEQAGRFNVQVVISDGLNALSIMEDGHLNPFLARLREQLNAGGFRVAPENLVVTSGRVRCGYRIGETLFADLDGPRAVVHIIGERPGTGHRTFSVYMTTADGNVWAIPDKVDHNITKVVSGIARTALKPHAAADTAARILQSMN